MNSTKETVFVGLSGGVDSSVSAQRLLRNGYTVVGIFIKTWQPDFLTCNWEAERLDAMRVAAHLNIPFLTFDAESTYRDEVAEYMITEYRKGRTPNPDVMCNQHVKFGAFLRYALQHGAEKVATGHYAQVKETEGRFHLYRGADTNKDQSYFLWTLTQEQLSRIIFPVGNALKATVRKEAEEGNLPTFAKHDSQGVCFLGEIDMREFLSHYVVTTEGDVLDTHGRVIGSHEGAVFYTIGQRHGFTINPKVTETTPHYVVAKDVEKNTITVSVEQQIATGRNVILRKVNTITASLPDTCEAQFRYRQKPFRVTLKKQEDCISLTIPDDIVELPSLGQSCVLYEGDMCLGGGIIDAII